MGRDCIGRMAAGRGNARRGAAAFAVAALLAATHATADTTHLTVRFRDAATGTTSPDDVARVQAISAAARTGLGEVSVTRDGAYRVGLAPPLSDEGGREALARLRMDPGVLYAEPATAAPAAAGALRPDGRAPRLARIVVKYRDPALAADAANDRPLPAARVAQLATRAGRPLAFERTIGWARAHLVTLMAKAPQADVEAMARAIEQDPDVEWAEPDYLRFRQIVPNDPLYSSQWHYFAPADAPGGANLPNAWARTMGWSGVRTAVLDTGALKTHPDLAGRFIGGYDFIAEWITANDDDPAQPPTCSPTQNPLLPPCISSRDADASDPGDWLTANDNAGVTYGGWLAGCGVDDSSWHGSHVAGTVGAATNNGTGVAGVNWVSRIVPVRVLGRCGGYDSDINDGIVWASGGTVASVPANAYPARVLNMSLGGGGPCSALTQNAINDALSRNAAVVVSAGNASSDAGGYSPANCNGVVTVASVGRLGQRASYSNYGAVVEIAAPGGSDGFLVLSTLNGGTTVPLPGSMNYVGYQGTSMAAPHVAGIASLMLSLKPSLTPGQVTTLMQSTARAFPVGTIRDCTVALCGAGIVNADAVLANIATTGGPGGAALAAATATLGSSLNPAPFTGPVTLTATVTGSAPTGTVAFTDADVPVPGCAVASLPAGTSNAKQVQCTTSALPVGTRSLRAVYSGDASNTPADSPILPQVVNPTTQQPSTTALASSQNPSNQGALVTFTATVTGTAPTGTVNFRANGVTIAGCGAVALAGTGDARSAPCGTAALPAGNNAIEAIYSGNAGNLGSTGTLTQGVIGTGACASFNDVASASAFCSSVQWMFNRGITTGCTSVTYCPDAPVTRLAMAAFLTREGSTLTPLDVPLVVREVTLNLTTPTIACFDPAQSFAVTGFPRRARLQAFANFYGAGTSTVVSVEHVYSTNGGTSWTPIPSTAASATIYAGRSPSDDRTVSLHGELDLAVGTSYLFGLRFSAAPAVSSLGTYCAYQTRIFNRNGTSAPF